MGSTGKGISFTARSVACFVALLAGCSRPLPEEGSASAELYRARCGGCHRAIPPSTMKLAAWEMILPRMEARMRASGTAVDPAEMAQIRAYLAKYGE
jgi:hypothetical protein